MITYAIFKTCKNTMAMAFKVYAWLFMAMIKGALMVAKVVANYVKK